MRARTAIPLLLVASLLAGCGGSDTGYEEVTLPPPTLTVPKDTGSTTPTKASATATPTVTPTATTGASSGTSSSGTTSGGTTASGGTTSSGTTSGGTTTGTGGATTQTQTQPQDTGGASPDKGLDQFCADNPGACDGQNP